MKFYSMAVYGRWLRCAYGCRALAWSGLFLAASLAGAALAEARYPTPADPPIPGSGTRIPKVGDDFEEADWTFITDGPKSSEDIDKQQRIPGAISQNERWYEGIKRGHPDIVKRVATPRGGVEGSTGSLLLRTLHSGVPGRSRHKMGQDDLVCDINERLGGCLPVSQQPSSVARVFVPPFENWERRSGPSFGYRLAVDTWSDKPSKENGFPKGGWHREVYWPGFFLSFYPKEDTGYDADKAYLLIRSDQYGRDMPGPEIKPGWWTLGLSVGADGAVHYFAKQGLGNFTTNDRVASHFPYGYKAQRFRTFFFNVTSPDDGRTWSTPWIVDDCFAYFEPKPIHVTRRLGENANDIE